MTAQRGAYIIAVSVLTIMEAEGRFRIKRRYVIVALAVVVAAVVVVAVLVFLFVRWAGGDSEESRLVVGVLRGRLDAEEAATEIIIRRMAREANVPAAELEALTRELRPISRDLPALSEGEKHKLAMLIRKSVADGRLTADEVQAIRGYSYRSARDGDGRP